MGETTIRITAQDFVTPPELAEYALAAEGAGRIGGVRLQLTAADGTTRLASCYQQVPLRVHTLGFGPNQPTLVYLLNPTAGLFDGDAQLLDVHADAGSRAFITGQSATRIHPCLTGFSTQQWRLRVEAGAIALVLPGPAIPFQGCRYFQRVRVNLAEGAHLVWGDLWVAGRYARGDRSERFQFRDLIQDLTISQAGRLIFRDRFAWHGPWDDGTAAWHFGGADAYGSLFTTVELPQREAPEDETSTDKALGQAIFKTSAQHTCLRWLGPVQAVAAAMTRQAFALAARADKQSAPWLLATHDLAPNHWFADQFGQVSRARRPLISEG
jgi:urease accessory protein